MKTGQGRNAIGLWIVVADSACARIFTLVEQGKRLEQIQEILHTASRAHERELDTDRPGRTFDSKGLGRHAMSQTVSPKEHEAWKLCKELADELETARMQERFDRLVLVAAPSILGQLRKTLSAQTAQRVARELNKNLVQLDAADILAHLPEDFLE